MAYPILAPQNTWWAPTVSTVTRANITEIEFKDSYTPDASVTIADSWDASEAKDGGITCYVIGTKLIIAGNGSGKIAANQISSNCFGSMNANNALCSVTTFTAINLLDTSNVTNMNAMFCRCGAIQSLDLSTWDVSNVTSMQMMFNFCSALSSLKGLSNWKTSSLTNIMGTFGNCTSLTSIDLSNWNTTNVTKMQVVFGGCSNLTSIVGLNTWDMSNVTSTNCMFFGCSSLTSLDLSNWNLSKMTDMGLTFKTCRSLTSIIGLSDWNMSNVVDINSMFAYCEKLVTLDLSKWDVSNVTTIDAMFGMCTSLSNLDISNWNVSKIEDMYDVFMGCSELITIGDLSNWDVSNVKYMGGMFQHCYKLTTIGDLSNWNTFKLERTQAMFLQCSELSSIGNISNWDVSNVTTTKCMFENCPKLTGIGDLANWDTSSCTDLSFMFWGASSIGEIDVSKWDVSQVTTFDHFAAHAGLRRKGIENWNTSSAVNMNAMFHNCAEEELDLSGYDVSNVQIFGQMFENSPNLKRIKGLENWDTSSGLGFEEMFGRCYKLEEVDLSSFDTSKAKNGVEGSPNGHLTATLNNMFYSCNNLKKVTVGPNFSINGDGTNTAAANMAILPTPSTDYIEGADGMWYTFNGDAYAPNAMKDRTAETYYASYDIVADMDVICKNGSLIDTAKAIREKSGATTQYTPSEFGTAIRAL